jgi:hypothetical protein
MGFRNKINTSFELTYSALGLAGYQGELVTSVSKKDSIVGWGQIKLPHPEGGTMLLNTLLKRVSIITTDSAYSMGAVIPDVILDGVGFTQGATIQYNYYQFYRENLFVPVLNILFLNNNYETPTQYTYNQDTAGLKDLTPATQIYEGNNQMHLSIYPNPTTGSTINIEFYSASPQAYTIEISDIFGSLIKTANTGIISGLSNISVDVENISGGTYFYTIPENDTGVKFSGKFVRM